MKIAFLITDTGCQGGVTRVAFNLANGFVENLGYEVDVVSFEKPNGKPKYEYNSIIKIKSLDLDLKANMGKLKKQFYFKSKIEEFFKEQQYDVVISTNAHFNVYLALCKNKIKSKVIGCEHGEYYHLSNGWRYITKLVYKKLDKIVILTEADRNLFDEFVKSVEVMPNAISFTSEKASNLANKQIIGVGRLDTNKNFSELINIFYKVQLKHEDWTLCICGDGEEKSNLEKQIVELGLQNKVVLKNFVHNIQEEFLDSSVFVMTSKSEGFPMVLIEAMECGVPCISYDIRTGPNEIITDKVDGFLVEKFNVDAMADSINKVIENEDLRLNFGEMAKKNVRRYNKDVILEKWDKILKEV